MCDLCEKHEDGQYECCQDCGVAICFDAKLESDWPERAGFTSSGDLYCLRHAMQYDDEQERADAEEYDDYDSFDDVEIEDY